MFSKFVLPAFAFVFFALSAASVWASGPTEGEIREKIRLMLIERHPDNRAERWTSLGPDAPKVIIEMIKASTASATRLRLVGALSHFENDPQIARFLESEINGSDDEVWQGSALRSYGISQGAAGTEFVSKFLNDPRPEMRIAAAETLTRIQDPAADAKIKAYLASEKTPWVATRVKESATAFYREGGDGGRSRRLVAPAATDDAPNAAWDGEWKGFLIRPDLASKGLKSEAIQARIHLGDGRIELLAAGGGVPSPLPLLRDVRLTGRKGNLVAQPAGSAASTASSGEPATAELLEKASGWMIEIQLPKSGSFLILRKS